MGTIWVKVIVVKYIHIYHIFNVIIYLLSSPYGEVRLFYLLSLSFLKRVELCYSRVLTSKFLVM